MPEAITFGTCPRKCQKRKGTKTRPPIVEPKSLSHTMVSPGIGLLRVTYFPGEMGIGFADRLGSRNELPEGKRG